MKGLTLLALLLMTGCSTERVLVRPEAMNGQTVAYARGASTLQSQSPYKHRLAVIDYSYDQMVIGLSLTNPTQDPLSFSENNVTVEQQTAEKKQTATVFNYEQLVAEADEKGEDYLALAGNTAAGVGAGFVPFGGIAYPVGRLLYTVGSDTESSQKRIDKLTYSQLNQNYLRQQTVEPGATYAGILKIGFPEVLKKNDVIVFRVFTENDSETFRFTCDEVKRPP